MKTKFLTTVVMLFLVLAGMSQKNAENPASEKETVKIFVTPEVRNLADLWIDEYCKANAGQNIELTEVELPELASKTAEENTLSFFVQNHENSTISNSLWQVAVGRDILVPVINSSNPFLPALKKQGVSVEELSAMFSGSIDQNWGALLNSSDKETVRFYFQDKNGLQESVANFLNIDQSTLESIQQKSTADLLKTVRNDKYAVAFCKLADVVDQGQNSFADQINLLPLDRNANGKIDYNESIFEQPTEFERSVWIGKYPKALVNNICAVAAEFPVNETTLDFLNWIVSSGQSEVIESGYSGLAYSEKQSNIDKLAPPVLPVAEQTEGRTYSSVYIWVTLILVVVFATLGVVIRQRNKRMKMPLGTAGKISKVMNENGFACPGGLYFDKSHTWVFMEEEGRLKLGIDDFISRITGDYTRVILKDPGEKVRRDEPIVTLIRKGKQISIKAPVSGTIREINEALVADPFTINNSPYNEGWVYKIEPSNWVRELSFLRMGSSYKDWIKNEVVRLKDFLACSFNIENLTEGKLVFQEGGELAARPLKDMSPEVWEDFQSHFIDSAANY